MTSQTQNTAAQELHPLNAWAGPVGFVLTVFTFISAAIQYTPLMLGLTVLTCSWIAFVVFKLRNEPIINPGPSH